MSDKLSDRLRAKATVARTDMTSVLGMINIMREAAAYITELEAQLDALRNPPYTTKIENVSVFPWETEYGWVVFHGERYVMSQDGFTTHADARDAAEQFIARLTGPFGSNGE